MSGIQDVLAALNVFSGAPDKASLDQANNFLQDFQHSSEAWATANVLLLNPDAPAPAKVFAAQTFRTKVIYDLSQVAPSDLSALRDTLLTALRTYSVGPRSITIQLCLALAGLALQFSAWTDAVPSIIDAFGQDPSTVPVLLQFLSILPEELNNSRIPITDDEWSERTPSLLGANSKRILELMAMYIQAPGVSSEIQVQVFNCLTNWLVAGEIGASDLAATRLVGFAFEALASDILFDPAVEVICALIHETQEVDENMPVIEKLVPSIIALRPQLTMHRDDPEKIKGYAKIFTEAGETFRVLILQHAEVFFPIVEAIGECSAYPDLDIVPITFPFWMRLSQTMGKRSSIAPPLLAAYQSLFSVIIRHLHFPPDSSPLIGQEADNFRSFRHVMGDTLKDCCVVLRHDACLLSAYEMVAGAIAKGPNASWQEIEAPLFAIRSMGAEMSLADVSALPKIMDLIPSLPEHPKVRYAALLIVSRYSEWINLHPEYLQTQLQYISAGFNVGDTDVSAAAGQALKFLCRDCKSHLVDFLPTLHTFLGSTGPQLIQDDRREVYEAIAFVISAMPMERAGDAFRTFSLDILSSIHSIASKPTSTKQDVQDVCDGLENLEVMLHVIRTFGNELPAACKDACPETWAVFENLLLKFGSDDNVAERATRVIRHGITMFKRSGLPIAASVVGRMSFAFAATGTASYIWIAGKVIQEFGYEEDQGLRGSFQDVYERSTTKVISLLQEKTPSRMPDVLEDYLHLLVSLLEYAPDIFFQSTAFPLAFNIATAALVVVQTDVLTVALDIFRDTIGHDCLLPPSGDPIPPSFPAYAAAIRNVIEKEGFKFFGYLLSGVVGEFDQSLLSSVVSISRSLAGSFPAQLLAWMPGVLQELPVTLVPNATKEQILADVTDCMNANQPDKVKYSILSLHRTSRQAKDRRRNIGRS